jgi:hypothetical protein
MRRTGTGSGVTAKISITRGSGQSRAARMTKCGVQCAVLSSQCAGYTPRHLNSIRSAVAFAPPTLPEIEHEKDADQRATNRYRIIVL